VERAAGRFPEIESAAARLLSADERSAAGRGWIDRLELLAPRAFRLRSSRTGTSGAARYLTRRQAAAVRLADGAFGADAIRQTIYVGGVERSLARRPGLWSVLSALMIEPGYVCSPDELARHAWGVDYHAVRHRSRLVVTIKRLRDALGGDTITAIAGGYRLSVPTWAVLEPVTGAALEF
jgi:DNA-binding response OmpR family regulator